MKKLTLISLLFGITAHAADYDISKTIDLSSRTNVNGIQLNQIVDTSRMATNKGAILVTNNTPDTAGNPRYTNFLWLDISTTPPILKFYATGSWQTASIAAGSIGTAQLADNSVSNAKIMANAINPTNLSDNAVIESKINAGAVTASKIGTDAVGTTAITNGAVTTAKLADNSITGIKIQSSTITSTNLASGSVSNINLAANAVNNTNLAQNAVNVTNINPAGSANQYLRMNSGASAVEFGTLALQLVYTNHTAFNTNTTTIPWDDSKPQQSTDGTLITTVTITPKNANSTLHIRARVPFASTVNQNIMALFRDSTEDAIAAVAQRVDAADTPFSFVLDFYVNAGSTTATTFKIHIGPATAGSIYLNGIAGSRKLGASSIATLSVTEIP